MAEGEGNVSIHSLLIPQSSNTAGRLFKRERFFFISKERLPQRGRSQTREEEKEEEGIKEGREGEEEEEEEEGVAVESDRAVEEDICCSYRELIFPMH